MDDFRKDVAAPQPNEWAVDLTREEYIRFNALLSKLSGPLKLHKIQLIITLAFFAGLLALCIYEWVALQYVDWLLIAVGTVLLLASFGIWWYIPRHARKAAAKAYDETIEGGYHYAGIVRLRGNTVEKENDQGCNPIVLDERTLFIETPDMLVFITTGRHSIVLPARYLTAEAATALRQAADKLPYRNRRFIGRIEPLGEQPTPAPAVEPTVLWKADIRYEPQEMTEWLRHVVKMNFIQRLPLHAIICLLAAIYFGVDANSLVMTIGTFLGFFALMLLFNLVLPHRNAKLQATMMDAASRMFTIQLNDRGVWFRGAQRGLTVLPWTAIEHVINRETFVEIIRGRQSIRIPKRYIEDISAFDTLISTVWKKTAGK